MRTKIVAGNWKMNQSIQEGIQLVRELNAGLVNEKKLPVVVVAPPYLDIPSVVNELKNFIIKTAAQDCSANKNGAYTGEVSALMLEAAGVSYVIIGHSERRTYFKESSELLLKKIQQALTHKLTPIYCIGEVLAEREANTHFKVIKQQLQEVVFTLPAAEFKNIVIAYEPVWAIGTGKTASPEQAQEIHALIRNLIAEKYDNATAQATPILYGGSCNAQNAPTLFAQPDVDGGLIGGASLKANDFIQIIKSF
jgi:triosephosphate isomerase (TIM)